LLKDVARKGKIVIGYVQNQEIYYMLVESFSNSR